MCSYLVCKLRKIHLTNYKKLNKWWNTFIIRFLSPVKAGSKVRGNYKLLEVEEFKGNGFKIKNELSIEIENEERPACVAETLGVIYPK